MKKSKSQKFQERKSQKKAHLRAMKKKIVIHTNSVRIGDGYAHPGTLGLGLGALSVLAGLAIRRS